MAHLRFFILFLIRLYQKTVSLDHGIFSKLIPMGICKFKPTCSEYGYEAIKRYGLFYGGILTCRRILRCHPWSDGGYDPVPKNYKNIKRKNVKSESI